MRVSRGTYHIERRRAINGSGPPFWRYEFPPIRESFHADHFPSVTSGAFASSPSESEAASPLVRAEVITLREAARDSQLEGTGCVRRFIACGVVVCQQLMLRLGREEA